MSTCDATSSARPKWRQIIDRSVRASRMRQMGNLAERDLTDRTLNTGTFAAFRQTASYGRLFWAAREWLAPSLIVERLHVDRPYLENLNAAKLELGARLTPQVTISAGPRI